MPSRTFAFDLGGPALTKLGIIFDGENQLSVDITSLRLTCFNTVNVVAQAAFVMPVVTIYLQTKESIIAELPTSKYYLGHIELPVRSAINIPSSGVVHVSIEPFVLRTFPETKATVKPIYAVLDVQGSALISTPVFLTIFYKTRVVDAIEYAKIAI